MMWTAEERVGSLMIHKSSLRQNNFLSSILSDKQLPVSTAVTDVFHLSSYITLRVFEGLFMFLQVTERVEYRHAASACRRCAGIKLPAGVHLYLKLSLHPE